MKMKNKSGEMSALIKILLWAVFIIIAIGGVYVLLNYLTNV